MTAYVPTGYVCAKNGDVYTVSEAKENYDKWDGTTVATEFAGGDGSEENPYQIATAAQLVYLRDQINDTNVNANYAGKYFILTNNIDLADYSFTGIGYSKAQFKGIFDGNGKSIKGLNATEETSVSVGHAGLFGYLNGAIIKNLSVSGNVAPTKDQSSTNSTAGGIVGYAYSACTISNCYFNGTVKGGGNVGGIVGKAYAGTNIINCGYVGEVTATIETSSYAGGICGLIGGTSVTSSISNCYSQGSVSGAYTVAGIANVISERLVTIDNCYSNAKKLNSSNSIVVCGIQNGGQSDTINVTNCWFNTASATKAVYGTKTKTTNVNAVETVSATDLNAQVTSGNGYNTWYDQADTWPTFAKPASTCNHEGGKAVKENVVDATFDAVGSYDEVVYCTKCRTEMSRNKITVPKRIAVATIGDTKYESMAEAFAAVPTNGTQTTITLATAEDGKAQTISEDPITLLAGQNVVLELSGDTYKVIDSQESGAFSAAFTIPTGASLAVQNGTIATDMTLAMVNGEGSLSTLPGTYFVDVAKYTPFGYVCKKADDVYKVTKVNRTAGDVNEDGYIDNKDAILIRRYLAGKTELSVEDLVAADYDGNKTVDASDIKAIQNYAVGIKQ